MKKHNAFERNICYFIPVICLLLFLLFCVTAGKKYGAYMLDQWNAMVIQGAPAYEFEQIKNLEADSIKAGEVKEPLFGEQFGEITCEAIDLKAPVYYGDTEELLKKGVGIYTGGYLPGEGGTVLAGGHDSTFFKPLEQIEPGDEITVSTLSGSYSYQVERMKAADISDSSSYEMKQDENVLILYTCYPFGELKEVRKQRYYVYAKEITPKEKNEE